MIKNISNLGDAAIYCDFGKEVNESINSKVISYFNNLKKLVKENKIEGITKFTGVATGDHPQIKFIEWIKNGYDREKLRSSFKSYKLAEFFNYLIMRRE